MANIKFSQFTVGNTESDIDFVVGYKGANNIQISPTNLLAASLSGYLPLTGGTMTGLGSIHMPDNFPLKIGSAASNGDAQLYHNGNRTELINFTGDLRIINGQDDGDITFRCDNGSGSTAEYFRIDGGLVEMIFSKSTRHMDDVKATFGSGQDLQIYHDGSNSFIRNINTNLIIKNEYNDGDIIFESDDGSGNIAEYFRLDGSSSKTVFPDNKQIQIGGGGGDGYIYSDGTNMWIQGNNPSADIKLYQGGTDGSIRFYSDNGSGGVAEYFAVDGGEEQVRFFKNTEHQDGVYAYFGGASDLGIVHSGADSLIINETGDLYIRNKADDKDIIFQSDDGSGGIQEYFRLDGSNAGFTTFPDNTTLAIGTDRDFRMSHDGTDTNVWGVTGDIIFTNYADDKDIVFRSDDNSGGVTEYFRVDGSSGKIIYSKNQWLYDNIRAVFGSSDDLQIFHNGTSSYIENTEGNIVIVNYANDKDIQLYSDDGSGGTTEYIRVDGSATTTVFSKNTRYDDNVELRLGSGSDFKAYHSGTNTVFENNNGHLYIKNTAVDKDIIFEADNGSGGVAEYFKLDGGNTNMVASKTILYSDTVKASFGNSEDLRIYHDGSNSYIDETGAGDLYVRAAANMYFQTYGSGKRFASFFENDTVVLYNNDVEKLRTIGSGIRISGVSEYADNTAAIAGGLTTGDVYRTGDLLKIVH